MGEINDEKEKSDHEEEESPSTLWAGTKIPEGIWELHLNLFTLDGRINYFDHVQVGARGGRERERERGTTGSESAVKTEKEEELPGCCSCKPRTEILVVGTGLMGRGILGILI